MMNRRSTIALLSFALLSPALPAAAQDKIPLAEISRYLNTLTTAEAPFTQKNSDGSTSQGKVFIRRPGRMRFEYAAPNKALVLASGGQVAIFDDKSNQGPQQYPLSRTPLNLILAQNVDLGRAKMVRAHQVQGGTTYVAAQDPERPEIGIIRMAFAANPTRLLGWVVTDESGSDTSVTLGPLVAGKTYPPSLFNITVEADKRGL